MNEVLADVELVSFFLPVFTSSILFQGTAGVSLYTPACPPPPTVHV